MRTIKGTELDAIEAAVHRAPVLSPLMVTRPIRPGPSLDASRKLPICRPLRGLDPVARANPG
jgi:hypothetical protein